MTKFKFKCIKSHLDCLGLCVSEVPVNSIDLLERGRGDAENICCSATVCQLVT